MGLDAQRSRSWEGLLNELEGEVAQQEMQGYDEEGDPQKEVEHGPVKQEDAEDEDTVEQDEVQHEVKQEVQEEIELETVKTEEAVPAWTPPAPAPVQIGRAHV